MLCAFVGLAAARVAPTTRVNGNPVNESESRVENETTPDRTQEYRLKAAFIYNFIKYTSWPEQVFADESSPIVVSIVGPDPFGKILDSTMKDKKIDGRAIVIERLAKLPETLRSHVAFTTGGVELRKKLFLMAKDEPVLVIGDQPGDAKAGSQVGFYLEKNKVRFEVNITRVKAVKLAISSELLKLARIIRTEEEG